MASCLLLALFCDWASSNRFSQALPEVMSSPEVHASAVKYEEAWVKNEVHGICGVGSSGGVGSFCFRKAGPVSHVEACISLTEIGRVPRSAGLISVWM